MNVDLGFLLQPPDFSTNAILTIEALAPLSVVPAMPGEFYCSQLEPTKEMLYGMLENILGWHFSKEERKSIQKTLQKRFGKLNSSQTDFVSILQVHLRFAGAFLPNAQYYYDFGSFHLKHQDKRHISGSRNHDHRAIKLLKDFADKKEDQNYIKELIKYYPKYYISPKKRGYMILDSPYRFRVETSKELATKIAEAVANPVSVPYLGTSDGWVEVEWEILG